MSQKLSRKAKANSNLYSPGSVRRTNNVKSTSLDPLSFEKKRQELELERLALQKDKEQLEEEIESTKITISQEESLKSPRSRSRSDAAAMREEYAAGMWKEEDNLEGTHGDKFVDSPYTRRKFIQDTNMPVLSISNPDDGTQALVMNNIMQIDGMKISSPTEPEINWNNLKISTEIGKGEKRYSRHVIIHACIKSIREVSHILSSVNSTPILKADLVGQEFLNILDSAFIFEENIKSIELEIASLESVNNIYGCGVRGGIQVFLEIVTKCFESIKIRANQLLPYRKKKSTAFFGFFSSSTKIDKLLNGLKDHKSDTKLIEKFKNEKITKETHSEWRDPKIHIEPFWYKYHPSLMKLKSLLSVTFATMATAQKEKSSVMSPVISVKDALKYSYQPDLATKRMREVHSDMTSDELQQIWNLLDYPLVAMINGIFRLSSVAVSQPFELPGAIQGYPILCRMISYKTLPFSISKLIPSHLQPSVAKSVYRSVSNINLANLSPRSIRRSPKSPRIDRNILPTVPIILHFHGGGFLSGSSAMHENYLREWAAYTEAVIISVDYRLAPKFKFPTATMECYEVYKWLVTTPPSTLGFNISKIAIVGDSAGGNLAIGVTLKAISEKLRIPDGVIAHYPVVDLTVSPTISRLIFTNDIMVCADILKKCLDAYVTPDTDLRDWLISPIYAPEELMQKFPRTYITSCEYDPLCDEAIAFGDRLKQFGRKVDHKVFPGIPHGVLSLSLPETKQYISETSEYFKDILDLKINERKGE